MADFNSDINSLATAAHQKILPRRGVAQIMDGAAISEVIYLAAPYGCGKTHAVLSWLNGRESDICWLNLTENSRNEETLAELTALQNAIHQPAKGKNGNKEKILVIDNFQFICNLELLRFVKEFIFACLGHIRLVIISRVELPPVFNDLVMKRHIRIITPNELNFSPQELADYLAMNGFEVSQSEIEQIHNETEGWPVAANTILAASHGDLVSYGETARGFIMTFFETEIWSGLRDDIKDFLLKTSILDKLTPSACYAVTGVGAMLPILKWLFTNGIFISKLKEENTFRYHHVFRDFLLRKLGESDINGSELYSKTAWWFFERGEPAKSFPYFFKAIDYYGMTQVLKILNPAEMGIEKYLEMVDCLSTLDASVLKPYPVIVARMAMISFLTGNIDEMQRLRTIFSDWLESGELLITPEEYSEYIWELAWLSYIDPTVSVLNNKKHEESTNYEEYVPHLKPLHYQRFTFLRFPSALSGIRDYCVAVQTIDAFIKNNEETGHSIIRGEYALFEMDLISAEYAYEIENFAKAEDTIRKIMVLAETKLHLDLYFVCTCLLVKIMRAMNNTKDIDAIINRLKTIIITNGHSFLLPNFHAFELRNRLSAGYPGFTEVFLEENEKYKYKSYCYLIYRHIAYVRGLISLGNFSEAMLLLGNLEHICEKYRRTKDIIELNILKAIASYGLGYHDGACGHLGKALKEAKEFGFIRIFSDDAKAIWSILEKMKKQSSGKYFQNVIISCKKALSSTGHKNRTKKYAHIELTKTELKILKSLQADMSYTEIALDNDIRVSTVKSHIHSIYSKLEVNNKTSAVITAVNQGII